MKLLQECVIRAENNLIAIAEAAGMQGVALEAVKNEINELKKACAVVGFVQGFDARSEVERGDFGVLS